MSPRRLDVLVVAAQRQCLLAARTLDRPSSSRHHTHSGDKVAASRVSLSLDKALFSSQPLENVVRVPFVRLVVILLILPALCIHLSALANSYSEGGIARFSYYRFTSLEQRDGSDPATPGIAEFGLLRLGERARGEEAGTTEGSRLPCLAHSPGEGVWSVEGASMTLSLGSPPKGDAEEGFGMWYIKSAEAAGSEGTDSVRFMLEASDDLDNWTTVGSSSVRYYYARLHWSHGYAEAPTERGRVLKLDATTPWHLRLYFLWASVPLYALAVVSLVLSFAGKSVTWSVLLNLWVQAVACAACLVALPSDGGWSAHAVASGLSFAAAALWLTFLEVAFEGALVLAGAVSLGVQAYWHQYVAGGPMQVALDAGLLPLGAGWVCLGVLVAWVRIWAMRRAVVAIQPGVAAYQGMWKRVREEEGEGVARLDRLVCALQQQTRGKVARQVTRNTMLPASVKGNRVEPSVGENDSRVWSYLAKNVLQSTELHDTMLHYSEKAGQVLESDSIPVRTLDQLHSQACLVSDMFVEVVAGLSRNHRGKFLLEPSEIAGGGDAFVPWKGGAVSRARLEMRGIKRVASCRHKLEFAYGHDVSRLLDMTRETLYFDTVADLESCLKAVSDDSTLEVVSVKSTMTTQEGGGQAALSAGMPFVSVHLRLAGDEQARSLCVDTHVCELLLMLTDIASMQTEEMRQAYREWRVCKRLLVGVGAVARPLFAVKPLPLSEPSHRAQESSFSQSVPSTTPASAEASYVRLLDQGGGAPHDASPAPEVPQMGPAELMEPDILPRLASLPASSTTDVSVHPSSVSVRPHHQTSAESSADGSYRRVQRELRADGWASSGHEAITFKRQAPAHLLPTPGATPASLAEFPQLVAGPTMHATASGGAGGDMPAMPPLDRLTRVGSRASLQSSAKSGEQAMEPAAKSGFGGYNVVGWLNGQAKAQVGYEFDGGETSWGLWVSGPMEELLEGLCRMSCLGISDFLDSRFEGVRKGTDVSYDTGSFGGIIFATRPVSSALRRLPLKVFLLAASVYLFYSSESARAVFDSELGKDFAFGPFEHYRLETLLTRNGTEGTQLAGPGVSAFGVIGSSGCSPAGSWDQDKTLPPPISSLAGTSMLATYPGGVRMLGWYMNTGKTQGSEALDPAFFNVWATNDDIEIGDGSCARGKDVYPWWKMADDQETRWCGARWTRVGAPRWRHRTSTYWDFVHTTVELPEARGSEGLATFLLMTPRQSYFVYWLWGTYPWAAGCLLSVLAATLQPYIVRARGFIPPPYLILWSGITASIVMSLTQLVVELQEGGMKSVALEIAMALTSSTTMSIVVFTQGFKGHMFLMLVVGSVVENLQWAVCCYIFWHDPMARISVPGLFFIILSVALLLFRQKAVWKSKRLLREHKIMYDETWNAIWASGEETRKELLNLQTLTEQLLAGSTLHTTGVRQYNRRRVQTALSRTGSFFSRTPSALSRTPSAPSRSPSAAEEYPGRVDNEPIHPLFLDIGLVTQPGVADPKSRIECFSQIYCQAAIANLLLMDRIKDWAEQSDGIFRDKVDGESEATFVRWRAVKGDAGGTQVVDRASTLKGHKRCIEKLLRVYHDDFSHLMDISRSCIVFSTIKALNECLQAIADDDDVVVERVKNRYHPDYDSEATAGYRDVCINLRLVSSQAKALGAELFVCEVQLQLLDFARLKTNGSHKRYVEARQSRGT